MNLILLYYAVVPSFNLCGPMFLSTQIRSLHSYDVEVDQRNATIRHSINFHSVKILRAVYDFINMMFRP